MAKPSATPESRKERYGTRGRPLSDWEALRDLWYNSEAIRQACDESFTRLEFHAFAERRTQDTADGAALTRLIWDELRARGRTVRFGEVHFEPAADPD